MYPLSFALNDKEIGVMDEDSNPFSNDRERPILIARDLFRESTKMFSRPVYHVITASNLNPNDSRILGFEMRAELLTVNFRREGLSEYTSFIAEVRTWNSRLVNTNTSPDIKMFCQHIVHSNFLLTPLQFREL